MSDLQPIEPWVKRLEDSADAEARNERSAWAPWYILRACTRQEARACESLKELGIEHYMPVELLMRKRRREPEPFERALFPGYLFAQIADEDYHAAIEAFGVHGAVMTYTAHGERVPRKVNPRLVAAIREAEARGDFDRTKPEPVKELAEGDSVHVVDGPFAGKIGAIVEMRGHERVALLLGGLIVEFDRVLLEAVA